MLQLSHQVKSGFGCFLKVFKLICLESPWASIYLVFAASRDPCFYTVNPHSECVLWSLSEVRGLTEENQRSLRKLQGTAEQFEWLCQQQRYWMCCVKRFKDCLMEERDALLRQVILLKKKTQKLKQRLRDDSQSVLCPLQDSKCCDCITLWDADAVADLESQVEKSNMLYAELFNQAGSPINEHQKPP
ncbi:hypothetical protein OYC64_012935 [Pagothenia borchgrevinki]|uniref:Uncharacterized protein n=1 Tax=Pagothenia borchgrevinki TaxID=8213 RepID=A0ABD2FS04_PAGBO